MKTIPRLHALLNQSRALEFSGQYLEAFKCLAPFWKGLDQYPDDDGTDDHARAELYLRCGSLAGFCGRLDSNTNAQENSRNLLMASRELFLKLDDMRGVVAAENGLACSYLRANEIAEADIWIESSFERDLGTEHFERVESFVVMSMALLDKFKTEDVIKFLKSVEHYFQKLDDNYLNGCYATNLGMAFVRAGRVQESMHMYSLARYYHGLSGHKVYQATVENNLACLYMREGRHDKGLEFAYRALDQIETTGDRSRYGSTLDTIASLYLAKGDLDSALEAVDKGLKALLPAGDGVFIVETLFTKVKILIAMKDVASASIVFTEVVNYARDTVGEKQVIKLAKEFDELIGKSAYTRFGRILTERIIPGDELELDMPASLSSYTSFDAVWVKNSFLAKDGLRQGDLAIVVDTELQNGDIVAVVEIGFDGVLLGQIEQINGMITIGNGEDLPKVFESAAIEILGRVVGYARPHEKSDGIIPVHVLQGLSK